MRIGLADAAAVEAAFDEIMTAARRHAPAARLDGVLVQEMVGGGIELIAGLSRQEPFGMGLVAGAGGVLVELIQDTTLELCPSIAHKPAPSSPARAPAGWSKVSAAGRRAMSRLSPSCSSGCRNWGLPMQTCSRRWI